MGSLIWHNIPICGRHNQNLYVRFNHYLNKWVTLNLTCLLDSPSDDESFNLQKNLKVPRSELKFSDHLLILILYSVA